MPYARRVDVTLKPIVAAYRALGCSVYINNDMVDIWVGYGGLTELVEVRSPEKIRHKKATQMTPRQVAFRATWTGGVRLVQSISDVAEHVKQIRHRHAAITRAAIERVHTASPPTQP